MRALVVTHLDLDQEPNQRTQHMIRMLATHCDEVVALYSVRHTAGAGWRAGVAQALRCTADLRRHDGVRWLRVDPWLNYPQALAHGLHDGMVEGASPMRAAAWTLSWRRSLANWLSSAGALRDLAWLSSMRAALRRHAPGPFDLALADGPWAGLVALGLRRQGLVTRWVYDDMDHVGGGQRLAWRRRWIERIETRLVVQADVAVSVGPELAALRQRMGGRLPLVLRNGADLQRFSPSDEAMPHPPTVLYMGRLEAARGVDLAVRAMPWVLRQLPAARLVVLGSGEPAYERLLAGQVAALGLQDVVTLQGAVEHPQLPRFLRLADVGVATFRLTDQGRYAVPLKVAEYMAAGLPVVCTQGSAAAGWVLAHGAGLAVPFEEQALAQALLQLLQQPRTHAAARQAGLAAARELAWPAITQRMWQMMGAAA